MNYEYCKIFKISCSFRARPTVYTFQEYIFNNVFRQTSHPVISIKNEANFSFNYFKMTNELCLELKLGLFNDNNCIRERLKCYPLNIFCAVTATDEMLDTYYEIQSRG